MGGRSTTRPTRSVLVNLQPANVKESRVVVEERLDADGWLVDAARAQAERWVVHDDFLLGHHEVGTADFVIGNPPYIRLEAVSAPRSEAYRRACSTMGGRSDVYVGFFEVGLNALRPGGSASSARTVGCATSTGSACAAWSPLGSLSRR